MTHAYRPDRDTREPTTRRVVWLLLGEAAAFGVAAAIHRGALVAGYQHRQAAIAESVIAAVLLAAAALSAGAPRWTRRAALGAQTFALLGTMVGVTMIAIGIGPQSRPDAVYHAVMIGVLVAGLAACARGTRPAAAATPHRGMP